MQNKCTYVNRLIFVLKQFVFVLIFNKHTIVPNQIGGVTPNKRLIEFAPITIPPPSLPPKPRKYFVSVLDVFAGPTNCMGTQIRSGVRLKNCTIL